MTLTVCFDVLHTCFSLEPLVEAVEDLMGDKLRKAGSGSQTLVMDWFHSAQRDFTMLSMINAPPPPISKILTLTLPRALFFALEGTSPKASLSSTSLPDLTPITSKLTQLSAYPSTGKGYKTLKDAGAKVLLITNGGEKATRGYVSQAGLDELVDDVLSCDSVGAAKPDKKVYEAAKDLCKKHGAEKEEDMWFVACHAWDVCAARKNGYKTGLVLSEQLPMGDQQEEYWKMYGGKPDIMGADLEEVCKAIVEQSR